MSYVIIQPEMPPSAASTMANSVGSYSVTEAANAVATG